MRMERRKKYIVNLAVNVQHKLQCTEQKNFAVSSTAGKVNRVILSEEDQDFGARKKHSLCFPTTVWKLSWTGCHADIAKNESFNLYFEQIDMD